MVNEVQLGYRPLECCSGSLQSDHSDEDILTKKGLDNSCQWPVAGEGRVVPDDDDVSWL